MCDMDVNSSDISEVFSDSDSLSSFDNEASGFYFNKLEYTEQVLRKYMTKFSSEDISNTKSVEDLNRLNWLNLDWGTCSFCKMDVGMTA